MPETDVPEVAPPGWDWEIWEVRGKCPTCGEPLPELICDCPDCHDLDNEY